MNYAELKEELKKLGKDQFRQEVESIEWLNDACELMLKGWDSILAALEIAAAMRWRKCSEEMPEEDVDVIAFFDCESEKRVTIAAYYKGSLEPQWDERGGVYLGPHVTHWMPLPAPPKEGPTLWMPLPPALKEGE